ncbi:peroxidase-related enzyme [Limobrevibacterium gyesilva]|uniref:Peroxidase-related enzyme n=1 Tax=Limobrevibacterium gyesilva TaxID=2991712 RepID=A0AA42CEG7_9PROT|nr:peroxidase-related enzyme [Limobrevibacterium gyesilva]MCW3476028.1 peroxidase-related enzyme [Limobrevibacterium gyesilva]
MPQPDHISVLGVPDAGTLDDDLKAIWAKCVEKLGFVPNVYSTYSLRPQRLRNFMAMYNEIMLSPSGLSKLEREMVAVVVSSANRCYYCLVAHGAAVRMLSGDPELGEMMALNYRVAKLDARQRAMLDFAWKMTTTPHLIGDADRDALRAHGLGNEDLFDLAETVAFFNLSNRMASATDMMPNREYHDAVRSPATPAAAKAKKVPAEPGAAR